MKSSSGHGGKRSHLLPRSRSKDANMNGVGEAIQGFLIEFPHCRLPDAGCSHHHHPKNRSGHLKRRSHPGHSRHSRCLPREDTVSSILRGSIVASSDNSDQSAAIDIEYTVSSSQYTSMGVSSHSSDQSTPPVNPRDDGTKFYYFKLHIPRKKYLDLPGIEANWGDSRWVYVKSQSGWDYKVLLEKKYNFHVLSTGWDLVAVREGFLEGQTIALEYADSNSFILWTNMAHPYRSQTSRTHEGQQRHVSSFSSKDYIAGNGTFLTHSVLTAMHKMWAAADATSKMFVRTIRGSQQKDGLMFFSREFSALLPLKKKTVALRTIASSTVICCSIQRYGDHVARITKGWDLFLAEHKVSEGDVLVFRFVRGPSSWEMLVCRA